MLDIQKWNGSYQVAILQLTITEVHSTLQASAVSYSFIRQAFLEISSVWDESFLYFFSSNSEIHLTFLHIVSLAPQIEMVLKFLFMLVSVCYASSIFEINQLEIRWDTQSSNAIAHDGSNWYQRPCRVHFAFCLKFHQVFQNMSNLTFTLYLHYTFFIS